MTVGPRAVIRLDALRENLNVLKSSCRGQRIVAAVKGNAYGHGLLTVARALVDVDCLAVARWSEAEALRRGKVRTPVMVLSGASTAAELELAEALDCWPVVHSASQVPLFEQGSQEFARVWLKVDTGMHRLGVALGEVEALASRLQATGKIASLGLMTHMANADDPEDPMTAKQLERFATVAERHTGDISISNSAVALTAPAVGATLGRDVGAIWIRPGIALYGISPFGNQEGADLGLSPVMQLETDLLDVKLISAGDAVGYGGTWRAAADTVLGIAAIGYGDGYPRHVGERAAVLINGRMAPVVGRVSMDLMAVDLGPDARDRPGDLARLWGDELPVERVARWANSIPYTLVTGVAERVNRLTESRAARV